LKHHATFKRKPCGQAAKTLTIDGREVAINGERNLLEVIRKAGIDLPTFCYHSDLSVYGACRLCLVDIEGRGIQGACSTPAEAGMKVRRRPAEIREIRKIAIELLLANHDQQCPTCPKSTSCQLQDVARKLGIRKVRFKPVHQPEDPVDFSSVSLVRDPNKCVLCGDCVRFCSEIQGIGAIDFAYRGPGCGGAAGVWARAWGRRMRQLRPMRGGLPDWLADTPRPEVDEVWKALNDPGKTVVVQVAPAVRVALGEAFGMRPGTIVGGQMVAALKRLGFDKVYDTSFSADLTVIEEANEFLKRKARGERLPQFTSCCPAWVKFAEQSYPDLLENLSTCKSPQQMLGALCKATFRASSGYPKRTWWWCL
jgi:NADH-quinone oxidoreductase subunit G